MFSTTERKRKADELAAVATGHGDDDGKPTHDDDGPDAKKQNCADGANANTTSSSTNADSSLPSPIPSPIPHLPAPVWGHVLDYMPYAEVRSALLVGKIIAVDAARHVQTLNIMHSWEMDVPAARRFASMTDVNILSLLSPRSAPLQQHLTYELCEATAVRTVPFLAGFQRLERVRVGGLDDVMGFISFSDAERYDFMEAHGNRQGIIQALLSHFIGAFGTRSLPTTLESLDGITCCLIRERPCRLGHERESEEDPTDSCDFCRKVLKYFPIKDIIRLPDADNAAATCFDRMEQVMILSERQDARKRFREASEVFLVAVLGESDKMFETHDDNLCNRLEQEGVYQEGGEFGRRVRYLHYLTHDDMQTIDRAVALGFDPQLVSQECLYDALVVGIVERTYDVFAKTTFDFLVSRKFPLAKADLIILDETEEPALKGLREKSMRKMKRDAICEQ